MFLHSDDRDRRRSRDYVSMIEAAYRAADDDCAWLAGLLHAVAPALDQGLGVGAYFISPHESVPALRVRTPVYLDSTPDVHDGLLRAATLLPGDSFRKGLLAGPCSSQSETSGLDPAAFAELPAIRHGLEPLAGASDAICVRAANPSGVCVHLVAATRKVTRVAPRTRGALSRVAAHIASAQRLRVLNRLRQDSDVPAEAVLDAHGRLLHAQGPAASARGRKAIQLALARQLQSRGSLRRESPEDALSLWQALVAGRWSLVEHVDTDNKRLLLARENQPDQRDPGGLTEREAAIAGWATLGHPIKIIAYELGLSSATVSEQLKHALRKLGLRSRSELVRLFGGRGVA